MAVNIEGDVRCENVVIEDNVIVTAGTFWVTDSSMQALTMTNSRLIGSNVRTNNLTATDVLSLLVQGLDTQSSRLIVDGCPELSITGYVGRGLVAANPCIQFTDVGAPVSSDMAFLLQGIIQGSRGPGLQLNNCGPGEANLEIVDVSRLANNTYDGVVLIGTCNRIDLRGGIHSAVGIVDNMRYGVNVGAGCTDIDIDMSITGWGTAPILNAAGLEVTYRPRISAEDPNDGDTLVWDEANEIYRPNDGTGIGGGGGLATSVSQIAVFAFQGDLSVHTGTSRFVFPINSTIVGVTAAVGGGNPTGASVIVDVHKNGTTIFTTQANRPEIVVSTDQSAHEVPDVTSVSAGEYITIDIDQIGSTLPGTDLTVIVEWRVA